ncbi:unnamed protein product [Arabis nemorensis]|uniref:Uncharacterized protein n=1 Tax=Arabis nemorensis TaxID=586526 RepID=A0A565AQK9_9BRAS|nr:unnamed protein product [Arabis nemorensis]
MNTESKGRAWYDKFYRKLETILVELDGLASQVKVSSKSSDPPGLDSVSNGLEKLAEDHCSGTFDLEQRNNGLPLQECKSPSGLPSDQKFDILQNVRLEGDSCKETDEKKLSNSLLREGHNDCNQRVATSLCREEPISSQSTHRSPESFMTTIACNDDTFVSPSMISTGNPNLIQLATEIQAVPVPDKVANIGSFSTNSMNVNQDEFFIEDFDDATLDTIDLYDMTFREDPSDFDDNLLYAARDRTRQLRSFKRKIMDALTSKRRREKEYEQLAIWFGDADMGCDLMNTKEHATIPLDSKSSQSNLPFASEDSEWELL